MKLTSPGFADGSTIPTRFTCDGADRSPALTWQDSPSGTKAFALICDDPDAPGKTWVHWVTYDLPATLAELPEGIEPTDQPPALNGGRQGITDFRRVGYGGPCPPPGKPHRYFFTLYALDAALGLDPKATKADVERAMQGHILGTAQLIGTYRRGGRAAHQ